MDIFTAEEAGFCFGVKRAIENAIKAADETENHPVYTLGPIIHNPQVVENLRKQGIKALENIDEIEQGTIIIRSHGVPPYIIDKAKNKGLNIIDATCPFVKKAQQYAKKLMDNGYQTIIYGDHNHPEVVGIYGATGEKAFIVSDQNELDSLNLDRKVGFVAQTTKSPASFKKLISSVIEKTKELKVYNTICNTTEIRQRSASELAKKVDIMFVIGGHNSANTNRLAEICTQTGTPTYHIETVAEIDKQWLEEKKKIGITAGASTPDWLIKEVIEAMSEEKKDVNIDENIEEEGVKEVSETEETQETIENNETSEEVNEATSDSEESTEEIDYSVNDIADLKKGQVVTGTVSQIKEDGIYVDVNYKTDGFIPLRELSHRSIDDPNDVVDLDQEIEVVILTLEDDEGNMILSKKRADYEKAWEDIMESYENDEIIEAEVTKVVKGGLVVDVGLRGFVPASHVAIGFVEDLNDYVGETLRMKVIEVERDKNNVVLSAKKVLEKERVAQKEDTLENLEEGQTVKGVVTKLVDFGAFVDLGGVEGLLHISEMSWGRIGHPSEVFEEGQEIEVKILSVDKEEERISLGYKQLLADPWEQFVKKHYEGEIITGTVTKIVDFGAFVEIEDGVEGLIHISQLSHRHVKTPDEVVTVGEEVKVKIISISEEQKRVGLSIKELEEKPEPKPETSRPKPKSKKETNEEQTDSGSGVTIRDLVGDIFDKDE
ncbi:MAG: bifunctional 4-hydroxy-3-methylbut-2-enyl diphosphate reductase/30S ribosomal protein S1 [Bacillota bacterium]